jgi:hypothetical protein
MLWLSGEYQSAQEIASFFIHPFLSKLNQQPEVEKDRTFQQLPTTTVKNPSETAPYGERLNKDRLNILVKSPRELTQNLEIAKYFPTQILSQGQWQSVSQTNFTNDDSQPLPVDHGYYPEVDDEYLAHYSHQSLSYQDNFNPEQLQLQEELMNAVYAYNVKVAVSTLRKMYTKQSKTFRIPVMLATILPDTASMIVNGRTDLLNTTLCFVLDCIQWCFGVHKGENFESFKYKMNANIARWLLRESVKKGIPSVVSATVYNATIKLFNQILDNYLELNFTYELLLSLNLSQPVPRMIPYIHIWLNSTSNSMKNRVHEFLYEHPEFAPYLSQDSNNPMSSSMQQQIALSEAEASSSYLHDQELESRLLYLLAKSNRGELGARIPTLYREEFGESIRLRGRKLKDILIGPPPPRLSYFLSLLLSYLRDWSS